jgi:hypothetical protein
MLRSESNAVRRVSFAPGGGVGTENLVPGDETVGL